MKLTKRRADLCFDVQESSSIKDFKHESKGRENTDKHFTFGPRQRVPYDFNELLKISSFKRQLLRFLNKDYEDPVYGVILGKKVFYCDIDNEYRTFHSENGVLKFEEIYDLYVYHPERDTHIIFYTKHADLIDSGSTVVRGDDTDIAVILSCNVEKLEKLTCGTILELITTLVANTLILI